MPCPIEIGQSLYHCDHLNGILTEPVKQDQSFAIVQSPHHRSQNTCVAPCVAHKHLLRGRASAHQDIRMTMPLHAKSALDAGVQYESDAFKEPSGSEQISHEVEVATASAIDQPSQASSADRAAPLVSISHPIPQENVVESTFIIVCHATTLHLLDASAYIFRLVSVSVSEVAYLQSTNHRMTTLHCAPFEALCDRTAPRRWGCMYRNTESGNMGQTRLFGAVVR